MPQIYIYPKGVLIPYRILVLYWTEELQQQAVMLHLKNIFNTLIMGGPRIYNNCKSEKEKAEMQSNNCFLQ